TVEQGLDELQIKTLPGNIPSAIEVDTTDLEPGHAIKVSDLNLGEGVEVLSDPDSVVVTLRLSRAPIELEEEAPAAEGEGESA
ncbi:50S ribosomal protein L25, partial [bacterium]|nr:50S ribosomal protein L25 [bacterium]